MPTYHQSSYNASHSYSGSFLMPAKKLLLTALAAGVLYWLIEAIFHIHLFGTSFTSLLLFRAGREIWLRAVFFALVCAGGYYTIHLLNALREMSSRLEQIDRHHGLLINNSPSGIIIVSGTAVSFINPSGAEMLGASQPEEIISKPLVKFLPSRQYQSLKRWLNRSTMKGEAKALRRKFKMISLEGREIDSEGIAFPFYRNGIPSFYLIFHSKTAIGYREGDILKRQRLDALGTVVSGIAHDFNNILSAIVGNISLVRSKGEADNSLNDILNDLEKATTRAKYLTKQLSIFSEYGTDEGKRYSYNLPRIIKESSDLVLHGSKLSCRYHFSDDLWKVRVDRRGLVQVINNVVINSREAMPAGGEIEIGAENIAVSAGDIPGLEEGDYVKIHIKDSGVGIPGKNLERVFENNFTTKKNSSGRGLSIVKHLLNSMGGGITIRSKPFFGTTAEIYLPAVKTEKRHLRGNKPKFDIKGPVKVLVMDDNELVRNVLGRLLINFGCSVEYTEDGEGAVDLYRKAHQSGISFDIAIFDLTVTGGMGAKEALRQLLQFDPEAKVIVSSGYINHPVIKNYRDYGFYGAIAKPYKAEELKLTLGKALKEK